MKANNEILNNMKSQLLEVATIEKRDNPKDRPRVRECLNNTLDVLIREIDFKVMKEMITEKAANQLKERLTNYTIKLHP